MITAIILTQNEGKNLASCLGRLQFANEIVVVDSGSQDPTIKIAEKYGCVIYRRVLDNFSSQRNFAMQQAKGDWILFVDADEWVTPNLAAEISHVTQSVPCAYRLPRRTYFFGKPLHHSGVQRDAPIRLFPKDSGTWTQPVHEYFETALPVKQCHAFLEHHTTRDRNQYMEKLGRYIPLEIETMKIQRRRDLLLDAWIRPPLKFLYLYIFKMGFLDGFVGFQFAALSAYYDYKKWSLYHRQKEK